MMMSARSAVQLPSSCRMTHRKKHNARSNISALIHLKPLVLQPAVRRCRQDTAIYRKIPARTHQMQQGAGMTPPQRNQQPHPANQPPQSWRNADQQQTAEKSAKRAQQENADSSRNITYQHTDGFHPTTLPRRSQKYRRKYATYMPAEPTGADPADSGIPTEPVVSKPSGSGVPAETVVPQPAEEMSAKKPFRQEWSLSKLRQQILRKPAGAVPAGSEEIPVEADGRHIQQANPIMEEAAPGSETRQQPMDSCLRKNCEEFLDRSAGRCRK